MRRAALLFAVSLFALSPATLKAQDLSNAPVFGQATCPIPIQCPARGDYDGLRAASSTIIAYANNCVERRLSIRNGNESIFDDSMGFDTSLCLTSRNYAKAETGLTMVPKCCIVSSGAGSCNIVCVKYGIK